MANNIETHTKAEAAVTFRPSDGENITTYLTNVQEALREMITDSSEFESLISSGAPITIVINGMPERGENRANKEDTETIANIKEDPADFDFREYVEARVREFADENPEFINRVGFGAFSEHIRQFFDRLTDGGFSSENSVKEQDLPARKAPKKPNSRLAELLDSLSEAL